MGVTGVLRTGRVDLLFLDSEPEVIISRRRDGVRLNHQ